MEEGVFLFDKSKTLIEIISPEDIAMNEQTPELNGLIKHAVAGKYTKKADEAQFFGMPDVDDDNIFWMYKIDKRNTESKQFTFDGTHILFDDLKGRGGIIKDRRPNNEPVVSILSDILSGTGWEIGHIQTSNLGTSNYYYTSKIEAFWDFLEKWRVEFRPRITFSKGKIVRKEIDIYNQLSGDHGKWYEKGDKLLSVVKEEVSSGIYTAFIGRGKGEEVGDGFGRRIGFEDVEWSIANGDPVDKPLGQDYVEIPWATAEYGYEDGSPRFAVVEFQDIEEEPELLEATYVHAVEVSRPKAQFKSNVIENGLAELGEIVTIISDDENIRYKTRIFKMKRDFKRKKIKTIEFGDKLVKTRAERTSAVNKTIKENERQNIEWLDQIRDEIVDTYFNNDGYNYDLKAGNEYDLPGGYYSFNRPIDQEPTKVIYMGAGQLLIANSKKPNGEWNWRTAATGDGFVADVVNTGVLNANLIKNGNLSDRQENTRLDLANGLLEFSHSDGSFTRIGRSGLQRYTSSDDRNYHYLIYMTTFVYGDTSRSARWIQLPDDFKGKGFQVYLSVADSLNAINYYRSIQRIVATGHPDHNIDYRNARVPIIAYKSETLGDGITPEITDVQGMLLAIY
jgi:phage minor structural protein